MAQAYLLPGFPFPGWVTETGARDEIIPGGFVAETTSASSVNAVVTQTLGGLTTTAVATAAVQAVVNQSLGALSQSLTAIAGTTINAVVNQTLGALTQATPATVSAAALATQTLGSLNQSLATTVVDAATAAQTLGALTQTAASTVQAAAAAAQTLGVLGQTSPATVGDAAASAQTLGALGQALTSVVAAAATTSETLGALSQTATAAATDTATTSQTLGALNQTSTAIHTAVNAVVNQTLGALGQTAATAAQDATAVAQTLGALQQAITLAAAEAATTAQTLGALGQTITLEGPGYHVAAAQTLGGLSQTAFATVGDAAAIAQNLGAISQQTATTVDVLAATTQALGALAQTATLGLPADSVLADQTLGVLQQLAAGQVTIATAVSQVLSSLAQVSPTGVLDRATVSQVLQGLQQAVSVQLPPRPILPETVISVMYEHRTLVVPGEARTLIVPGMYAGVLATGLIPTPVDDVIDNAIQLEDGSFLLAEANYPLGLDGAGDVYIDNVVQLEDGTFLLTEENDFLGLDDVSVSDARVLTTAQIIPFPIQAATAGHSPRVTVAQALPSLQQSAIGVLRQQKIGVYAIGYGDFGNQSADNVVLTGIKNIGFQGYYTFDSDGTTGKLAHSAGVSAPSVTWFPAFWDPAAMTSARLTEAQASGQLIIGFNEPWNGFGGFRTPLTPTQCLDAWPALLALGNRLASPSISGPTDGSDWLAQFMDGATSRGYRVDVINVHYYAGVGVTITDFQNYLQSIHTLYGRPIIVTEWARANWGNNSSSGTPTFSFADQAAWARAGCNMMGGLDFVEHHFWYGATQIFGTYQNNGAMNQDGSLTLVGQEFLDILRTTAQTTQTLPGLQQIASVRGPLNVTWSPTDRSTNIALSNGDLTGTVIRDATRSARATQAGFPNNYFEVVWSTAPGSGTQGNAGIALSNTTQSLGVYPGDPNSVGFFASGYVEWPGSGTSNNTGVTWGMGDNIGVRRDASSAKLFKNGTLVYTVNTLPAGPLYPLIFLTTGGESVTANFGASAFAFAPSGATPWGQFNVGGYVCDGDSLTRGAAQDGVPVTPYPSQLATLTGLPVVNLGIDGQSMFTMDANYAANVAPRFNAGTANVLLLEGGGNDLPGGGTATSIGASVRSYCAKARATGFRVYLMTMPPININNDSRIDAINADRRSTWASYCDGLIDIAADPAFSDVGNRTYYQTDNTHWRTAADAVVANLVKVATLGP